MHALRALVFDVDGTLAETERDGHRIAFNRAFESEGLPWHWDVATYGELLSTTGGKERMERWWRQVDAPGLAAAQASGAAAVRIRALHEAKTAQYLALLRAGAIGLRPGVRRLLHEARAAGLTLAIATTTSEPNVRELIEVTLGAEALGWFAVIGAGDVVPHKKPAPDIYQWVLQRLGLPADACLAVEDSAPGVAAARAAGLPTLLTRSIYTAPGPIGEVLADLDGLGEPDSPAHGHAPDGRFEGPVDVATLRRWFASTGATRAA